MRQISEFIAVLSCALFTGAAVYITFIEHPARMQCGVEIAATEFAPSYRRATVMQATCAALGLLASVGAWLAGATFSWLVGGVLLGSVIPFTLIAILPPISGCSAPHWIGAQPKPSVCSHDGAGCIQCEACSVDWLCCFSYTW
jgi:hypothetical protein